LPVSVVQALKYDTWTLKPMQPGVTTHRKAQSFALPSCIKSPSLIAFLLEQPLPIKLTLYGGTSGPDLPICLAEDGMK
jgi:hypothetical protein